MRPSTVNQELGTLFARDLAGAFDRLALCWVNRAGAIPACRPHRPTILMRNNVLIAFHFMVSSKADGIRFLDAQSGS